MHLLRIGGPLVILKLFAVSQALTTHAASVAESIFEHESPLMQQMLRYLLRYQRLRILGLARDIGADLATAEVASITDSGLCTGHGLRFEL